MKEPEWEIEIKLSQEKVMPDYRKGSVSLFETKPFQDWLKTKGYIWPPAHFDERDALYNEFMRDGFAAYGAVTAIDGEVKS